MAEVASTLQPLHNSKLMQVAREIAIGVHPLDKILSRYEISHADFERLKANPRFTATLEAEIAAWNSAHNTAERIKLKSQAMVEEALPELFSQIHNSKEPLSSRIEAMKLARDLGQLVKAGNFQTDGDGGSRFSVTINLGDNKQIKFEKDVTPQVTAPPVIDAVPT
jgi:hypothetical protein